VDNLFNTFVTGGQDMIDDLDISTMDDELYCLSDDLDVIITGASSDQYKDSHIEELSNFVAISEKLKELGYEPGGG